MNINIAPFIYKISIPARFFGEIYRFLVDMGYAAARIYPGYGGVAKAIGHDRYLIPEEMNVNSGVTFVR